MTELVIHTRAIRAPNALAEDVRPCAELLLAIVSRDSQAQRLGQQAPPFIASYRQAEEEHAGLQMNGNPERLRVANRSRQLDRPPESSIPVVIRFHPTADRREREQDPHAQ